jgi:hypothetical protein
LIIKRGTKLHINMGNYESVDLWVEVEGNTDTDSADFLRTVLDGYLEKDLKEALECSGLDANSSFAHHWKQV